MRQHRRRRLVLGGALALPALSLRAQPQGAPRVAVLLFTTLRADRVIE